MAEKKGKKLITGVSVRGTFYAKGTPLSKIKKEHAEAIGKKLFK